MKHIYASILALVAVSFSSHATLYGDGETDTFAAGYNIKNVNVSNTDSTLTFKITLTQNADSTIRYLVAIDSANGGSFDGAPDTWSSCVKLSGMDYFISGGPELGTPQLLQKFADNRWQTVATPQVESTSSSYTYTIDTTAMNLAAGNTLKFDVYTSRAGSGSGLADALSISTKFAEGWNNNYTATGFNIYTITAVPEPAHYGLMCAGGLLGIAILHGRRKKSGI